MLVVSCKFEWLFISNKIKLLKNQLKNTMSLLLVITFKLHSKLVWLMFLTYFLYMYKIFLLLQKQKLFNIFHYFKSYK